MNVTDCVNCADCANCICCHNCDDCTNCNDCFDCDDCTNCSDCALCEDCVDCDYCVDCYNCYNCFECNGCHDYIEDPKRYVTPQIGSRNDNTYFYYGKTKDGMSLQVTCGCFKGDLEEFEKAVLKTHKDNELYREQYLSEIKKVKKIFQL